MQNGLNLNRHFTKEDTRIANKQTKRQRTFLVIKKRYIKTTRRYHHIPIRTVTILSTDHTKCWQGCGAIGALLHWWWECKMLKPLQKTVWQPVKTLNITYQVGQAFHPHKTYI